MWFLEFDNFLSFLFQETERSLFYIFFKKNPEKLVRIVNVFAHMDIKPNKEEYIDGQIQIFFGRRVFS